MNAGELCIRRVVTADPEESVVDAAKRMRDESVGDLVVVEEIDGKVHPVGLVTDRDLVTRSLADGPHGLALRVGDIMEESLVTATEDDDLETVLAKLEHHDIRRIPIVDHAGALQGILTLDDVVTWIGEQLERASAIVEHQGEPP
jgi:CBS domain-containing protein